VARRHPVYGFFLDPDGAGIPPEIRRLCVDAVALPLPRARLALGAMRARLGGTSVHAGAFWWASAQRKLDVTAGRWNPDAVHVHRLRMIPYAEPLCRPYAFDATDCLTAYYREALASRFDERRARLRGWRRIYAALDLPALRRAERAATRGATVTLVTTPLERDRLRTVAGGGRVEV
ncbi:MAG: hypothetical protein AAB368_08815, partial [bacterium]